MKQDWPHQAQGLAAIFSAFEQGSRSVCFQLATGGGKSRIIRRVTERYHDEKRCVYLVTHRKSLVRQLADELYDAGINYSIVMPGYPMLGTRIQVCSLFTLVHRFDRLREPEMIIIDEAHHAKCSSYQSLRRRWPGALWLGLTATPQRTDGSALSDLFDRLITGPSMRDLIAGGFLCDYDYYAPETVDMSGVRSTGGEYNAKQSAERVDRAPIIGNAVEHYQRHADHQPAIACCVSIAHAEHVAERFRDAGYRALAVHSRMDDAEITRGIAGLRDGSIEVLCQCELIGEGVNIPGASVLIQLRPTQSIVVYLQQIGRVLRGQPGKRAVVLDHVGNWERHGLPDDPREWSLDGTCGRLTEQSIWRRCDECLRVIPKSAKECPFCGAVVRGPELAPVIPTEDEGTLVNVRERPDLTLIAESLEEHKTGTIREIAARARTLKEAVEIARERGYENHRFAWMVWTKILKRRVA
jgi:superfamily II DNA or RNA helicase